MKGNGLWVRGRGRSEADILLNKKLTQLHCFLNKVSEPRHQDRIIGQQLRIYQFDMGGTGRTGRHNSIQATFAEGQDIFSGHVPGGFDVAQTESRKAATGLARRKGYLTQGADEFQGSLSNFRIKVVGCATHKIADIKRTGPDRTRSGGVLRSRKKGWARAGQVLGLEENLVLILFP